MRTLTCLAAGLVMAAAFPAPAPAASSDKDPREPRSCSIADNEIVRIVSWDLDGAFDRIEPDPEAYGEVAAMLDQFNADVVALQGLSGDARELTSALAALQKAGRCYHAVLAPGGLAIVFDPQKLAMNYAEGLGSGCDGKALASSALHRRPAGKPGGGLGQLSWFRVASSDRQAQSAFDFALLNADADAESLAKLAARYQQLDSDHAWLAEERDRIVIGDLAVQPARLTRMYFPGTKSLINVMLKINIGLSDKSFDEAVRAAMRPGSEASRFNDTILVRRWDQPGTCPGEGYCGGLEEFINARIYPADEVDGRPLAAIGSLVHPPVAARFCKFADSDPPP